MQKKVSKIVHKVASPINEPKSNASVYAAALARQVAAELGTDRTKSKRTKKGR